MQFLVTTETQQEYEAVKSNTPATDQRRYYGSACEFVDQRSMQD